MSEMNSFRLLKWLRDPLVLTLIASALAIPTGLLVNRLSEKSDYPSDRIFSNEADRNYADKIDSAKTDIQNASALPVRIEQDYKASTERSSPPIQSQFKNLAASVRERETVATAAHRPMVKAQQIAPTNSGSTPTPETSSDIYQYEAH